MKIIKLLFTICIYVLIMVIVGSGCNCPNNTGGKKEGRVHIVQRGETLSDIARIYYGSDEHWTKIFQANSEKMKNPNTFRSGMQLVIP